MQDPTEKHCGDVGILVKYKDNNNKNNNNNKHRRVQCYPDIVSEPSARNEARSTSHSYRNLSKEFSYCDVFTHFVSIF